jgi:tetratricopeptide (TPR) repeat protein
LSASERLQLEAIDLTLTHDLVGALAKYEQARDQQLPGADTDLGRAYERANRMPEALAAFRKAVTNSPRSGAAWLRLGVLEGRTGDDAGAAESFRKAEELFQADNNLEGLVQLLLQRGVSASRRGDYKEAVAAITKSRDLAVTAGNIQQEIGATLELAMVAYAQGDSRLAEQYAQTSLEKAQANQMEALSVKSFLDLGNARLRAKDFASAEKYYQSALTMSRAENSYAQIAVSLLSLASLHEQTSQRTEEEREVREALDFYRPNGYSYQTSLGLILLGRLQRERGSLDDALQSFKDAAVFAEKSNNPGNVWLAQDGAAATLLSQGRLPEALDLFLKNSIAAPGDDQAGWGALRIANVSWRLGRYAEAERRLAVAAGPAARSTVLHQELVLERAEMMLSSGKVKEALQILKAELVAGSLPVEARARYNQILGVANARSGEISGGKVFTDEALAAMEKRGNWTKIADAGVAELEVLARLRDAGRAAALFQRLEPVLRVNREQSFRALAWLATVDSGSLTPAKTAGATLKKLWGDRDWTGYASRDDIRNLLLASRLESLR